MSSSTSQDSGPAPSGLTRAETALLAHDLRNLIATVLGHAELQQRRLEDAGGAGTELAASLRAIQLTASRAVELCESVLALSHGGLERTEPVDLAEVAASAAAMFEARTGPDARCVLEGRSGSVVTGNRLGLERAVLNLLWNAFEAVSESGGRPEVQLRWGGEAGRSWLEVLDNGPGLPGGTLAGLSEPFRSSKRQTADPQVRGLGLHAAALIMRFHGGRLSGRNPAGGGALLRLEFGLEQELDFVTGVSEPGR